MEENLKNLQICGYLTTQSRTTNELRNKMCMIPKQTKMEHNIPKLIEHSKKVLREMYKDKHLCYKERSQLNNVT